MKKVGSLFQECEENYYKTAEEKNCSMKLVHYVWDVLLKVQRGYSFNRSHCLAYSLIALQEMNLCFKYPIIYWNAACLITDSGSEDAGTDYNKIAAAIGKFRMGGVDIKPPDINSSNYGFTPNEKENAIYCGFKSLLKVGEDVINGIIENRPYISPRDFYNRVKPKKQAMISLIKCGAFDNMMDRKLCMGWYLWEVCDKKTRLTLQNLPGLISHNIIPLDVPELALALRVYEFNRYLKAKCKDVYDKTIYLLDTRALNFLREIDYEFYSNRLIINQWEKYYQSQMDIIRTWINSDKENILKKLNYAIFLEEWNSYASGTISSWEMETLCFYYHSHELQNVPYSLYGFSNFYNLPKEPIIEKTYTRGDKTINLFKLTKICGTCIAKNKAKGIITVLTTNGVVDIKFSKELCAMFDKQISVKGNDGKKKIIERSWFNRGNMIVVQGVRIDDMFIAKKYQSSGGHLIYHIDGIKENNELELRSERYSGTAEDDEEI